MLQRRAQRLVADTKRSIVRRFRRVGAASLDGSRIDAAMRRANETRVAFRVTPTPRPRGTENGYDSTLKLLEALHNHDTAFSVELWQRDGVELVLTAEKGVTGTVEDRLATFFPNASLSKLATPFPEVEPGTYVAGTRLGLRNDHYLQIANPMGANGLATDPYNEVMEVMSEEDRSSAVIQALFRPVPEEWWRRWYVPLTVGDDLRSEPPLLPRQMTCDDLVGEFEHLETSDWARDLVRGQRQDSAFVTELHVCGLGDTPEAAKGVVKNVASVFEECYEDPTMDQGLVSLGVPARQLPDWFDRLVERRLSERRHRLGRYKSEPCLLTVPELAAVAHIPSRGEFDEFALTTSGFSWADGEPIGQ
jgi:hypothetical protein